jgi:hypothetical protein
VVYAQSSDVAATEENIAADARKSKKYVTDVKVVAKHWRKGEYARFRRLPNF